MSFNLGNRNPKVLFRRITKIEVILITVFLGIGKNSPIWVVSILFVFLFIVMDNTRDNKVGIRENFHFKFWLTLFVGSFSRSNGATFMNSYTHSLKLIPLIIFSFFFNSGCSGISKGITEAVLEETATGVDAGKCYIHGRSFPGLAELLAHQNTPHSPYYIQHPVLKILMIHGIGSHAPGYSTRLAENLALALNLNRVDESTKKIVIAEEVDVGHELGILTINRYRDANLKREMIVAELTWDPIIEQEKARLSFDNSGAYSFRRTYINNQLKSFVNDTIPDVLMYNGSYRLPIQLAIGQSMCWLMSHDWKDLPASGRRFCDNKSANSLSRIQDDFVFITHSLGSRITVDALQFIASAVAARAQKDPTMASIMNQLQESNR